MKKLLMALSRTCCIGGGIYILGIAGMSDGGIINIPQILIGIAIGLGIILIGYGIRKVVL